MFRISSIEKSNIRFFGNAGIGFGFVLNGEVPFDDFRKNDYTANLGAGIKYKVISLEARYERTTGFSKFIDINDRIQSFYFLVNWQLTHKKNQ